MNADDRCARVLAEMEKAGLDALIVVCGNVYEFQRPNAVHVLSGFRAIGDSFVVLRADGRSSLVVSPAWELERAEMRSRTTETTAADSVRASLAEVIETLAMPHSRLGFVGLDSWSYADVRWLGEIIGGPVRNFDTEFRRVTRRKSAVEIANAERATYIAEQGYALLLRSAKPGMCEIDLAEDICTTMAAMGADDNFLMLSAGQHNRAVRPPGSRKLERNDLILCEMSPSFEGQFSQICRTAMVGTPSRLFLAKYDLLRESFRNGLRAAVPGARVADLVEAVNENLISAGYGEFCVPPHMRARGHGLGFGSLAPGDLSAGSDAVIERDMVFVIHPNQYIPETGYMMCGDPIIVTETGGRNLAARPASLDQAGMARTGRP
jgi:Xaa-Pro dipeptidase